MAKLIHTEQILNNEEIITKVKQLGMMHLLYWMRRNVYRALTSFNDIPEYIQIHNSVEEFIFTFINTEEKIINLLNDIEHSYNTRKH